MDKKALALEEYEDWKWLFDFEHDNSVGEYMNGTQMGGGQIHLFNKQTGVWRAERTIKKVYPGIDVTLFVAGWEFAKGGEGDAVAENLLNGIGVSEQQSDE